MCLYATQHSTTLHSQKGELSSITVDSTYIHILHCETCSHAAIIHRTLKVAIQYDFMMSNVFYMLRQ